MPGEHSRKRGHLVSQGPVADFLFCARYRRIVNNSDLATAALAHMHVQTIIRRVNLSTGKPFFLITNKIVGIYL